MIIDVYNDPYCQRLNAHKKRNEFEKLKKTNSFQQWRERQIKVQDNRCAYCKVRLDMYGIVTHIDHITPLYHDGKNEYTNFVLSCRRCNMRKWVANNYVYPEWIKDRDIKMRQQDRLKHLHKQQYQQRQELLDDCILDRILANI